MTKRDYDFAKAFDLPIIEVVPAETSQKKHTPTLRRDHDQFRLFERA
jgi:hypothetical protein